ncbi:MAG: hypothetical protein AAF432_00340 [Planctomycetota bacterium]
MTDPLVISAAISGVREIIKLIGDNIETAEAEGVITDEQRQQLRDELDATNNEWDAHVAAAKARLAAQSDAASTD